MFSPTILLLIGGFTIAAALSKSNIDRVLITRVLSLAGTRPSVVLLAFMGVSCFASMWIRYAAVATPVRRRLITPCLQQRRGTHAVLHAHQGAPAADASRAAISDCDLAYTADAAPEVDVWPMSDRKHAHTVPAKRCAY